MTKIRPDGLTVGEKNNAGALVSHRRMYYIEGITGMQMLQAAC